MKLKLLPHSFSQNHCKCFVRCGKVTPYKTLLSFPQSKSTFESLASNTDVSQATLDELEHFVCCMYGKSNYSDVNKLRYDMFRQKFKTTKGQTLSSTDGVDLSLLPPCKSSLHMHILRCNYQAYIWNMSNVAFPNIPSPENKGWRIDEGGKLRIDWTKGDIVPQELIDIIPDEDINEDFDVNDLEFHNMLDVIYEDDDDDDS